MFRIDESIERAEVLQGGPGVVYSNGQLGATANFILRQGTADPHGDIWLTVGTDHGYRVDGFYGGPLCRLSDLFTKYHFQSDYPSLPRQIYALQLSLKPPIIPDSTKALLIFQSKKKISLQLISPRRHPIE